MMNKDNPSKKYNTLIIIISIAIPLIVALLFKVRIPDARPMYELPPIYASINALTAVMLVVALLAIKKGKRILHERIMKVNIFLSLIFLVMYIIYHMTTDPTSFGGEDTLKYIYLFILITHIVLSIALIPLVLLAYSKAAFKQFETHKKIARFAFPIWLYVTVTGVVVYLMISPYYP